MTSLQAGRTAAVYGTALCFRIEGCAFLIATLLLLRLARRPVPAHGARGSSL